MLHVILNPEEQRQRFRFALKNQNKNISDLMAGEAKFESIVKTKLNPLKGRVSAVKVGACYFLSKTNISRDYNAARLRTFRRDCWVTPTSGHRQKYVGQNREKARAKSEWNATAK